MQQGAFLFIDTTNQEFVNLALITDSGTKSHVFKADYNLSEILVPEINKFLAKQKVKFKGLKRIAVVAGSGHFSKVRTAVAVANALSYGLHIPVVGIRAGQKVDWRKKGSKMVKPIYDKQPNITVSKK